jgi:hypothetical protein
MDGTCSTHLNDNECARNLGGKPERKGSFKRQRWEFRA